MLGQPKFKCNDLVSFYFEIEGERQKIDGVIDIVDADGTSEQKEEPSYDIDAFFRGEAIRFKHVRESDVTAR